MVTLQALSCIEISLLNRLGQTEKCLRNSLRPSKGTNAMLNLPAHSVFTNHLLFQVFFCSSLKCITSFYFVYMLNTKLAPNSYHTFSVHNKEFLLFPTKKEAEKCIVPSFVVAQFLSIYYPRSLSRTLSHLFTSFFAKIVKKF